MRDYLDHLPLPLPSDENGWCVTYGPFDSEMGEPLLVPMTNDERHDCASALRFWVSAVHMPTCEAYLLALADRLDSLD